MKVLLLALITVAVLTAETKLETDLRQQLADSQAREAATAKERSQLSAAVAALTKQQQTAATAVAAAGKAAATSSANMQGLVADSFKATADHVAVAESQADLQTVVLAQAAADAKAAALRQEASQAALKASNQQQIIVQIGLLLTVIVGYVWSYISKKQNDASTEALRQKQRKEDEEKRLESAKVAEAKLEQIGATTDKVHALANSAMTAAKESTAAGRRADATSRKLIFRMDPSDENRANAETAERVAAEAEETFRVHQETQAALNRNDKVAQEKVAKG